MKKLLTRFIGVACLGMALVGFALTASAEDWKKGRSLIDSVDSASRTITINDEVYHVPESCRIQRRSGVRVPLSDLRGVARPDLQLVPIQEVDYVEFEAVQKRSGWEMVEITIFERALE